MPNHIIWGINIWLEDYFCLKGALIFQKNDKSWFLNSFKKEILCKWKAQVKLPLRI